MVFISYTGYYIVYRNLYCRNTVFRIVVYRYHNISFTQRSQITVVRYTIICIYKQRDTERDSLDGVLAAARGVVVGLVLGDTAVHEVGDQVLKIKVNNF